MKNWKMLAFVACLSLYSCSNKELKIAEGFTQGTTYTIQYYSEGADYQYQVDSLLLAFDRVLSTYQENSYISKWNANKLGDEAMPEMFFHVVKKSIEIGDLTDGAFDITVSPLMNFWFDSDWKLAKSKQAEVDSIKMFVGQHHLSVNKNRVAKDDPRVQLDVNAIAQGYSVDVVAWFLERQGIYDYLVEIGGELRARGVKDNGNVWTVGIERPDLGANNNRETTISVHLENRSLATSGNYRKFIEIEEEKLGHSLNPKTGLPASTNVLSATVITTDCITADALATACIVLGFEKAKSLIESKEELDAVLIYAEGEEMKTWISSGVKK